MHSDERIEDLANELGIDSGTSSNSADRMRKVAEAVGMNDFNSLYDVDKLEEKLKEQVREKRANEDLKREEDLKSTTNSKKIDKIKIGFKMLPLKWKVLIISIIIGLILTTIFITVLISPYIVLDIIKLDTSGSSSNSSLSNYSQTSSNISYWWPIGSSETRTENGVTYADGEPVG